MIQEGCDGICSLHLSYTTVHFPFNRYVLCSVAANDYCTLLQLLQFLKPKELIHILKMILALIQRISDLIENFIVILCMKVLKIRNIFKLCYLSFSILI